MGKNRRKTGRPLRPSDLQSGALPSPRLPTLSSVVASTEAVLTCSLDNNNSSSSNLGSTLIRAMEEGSGGSAPFPPPPFPSSNPSCMSRPAQVDSTPPIFRFCSVVARPRKRTNPTQAPISDRVDPPKHSRPHLSLGYPTTTLSRASPIATDPPGTSLPADLLRPTVGTTSPLARQSRHLPPHGSQTPPHPGLLGPPTALPGSMRGHSTVSSWTT